jgi:predicted MFS family arabinose efflux permease
MAAALALSDDVTYLAPVERPVAHSKSSNIYLLVLIALVEASLEADRNFFSVALIPIKREFLLSDSQLGAINGLAFAMFFGLASIPIARLTERLGHIRVIAGCIAAWSAFTAVTAFATGFATLFTTRILVGVGEAGCHPALQSLIAARFSPQQRSGALSVWSAGNYLGIVIGLALGGAFVEGLGWRTAFLLMGGLGIVLAPLVWLTLKDAPRPTATISESLRSELWAILRTNGIVHFLAMVGLMGITTYATIAWAPAFYARYYAMNAAQVGAWVGFIFGGGAVVGSLMGGVIASRLTREHPDAGPSFILWTTIAFTPLSIAAFVADSRTESMIFLFLSVVVGALPAGPIFATLHDLVEPRQRAVAVALVFVASMVVGGAGPFAVGLISDFLGEEAHEGLRASLVVINCVNIWTLVHMYYLLITYRRRLIQGTLSQ